MPGHVSDPIQERRALYRVIRRPESRKPLWGCAERLYPWSRNISDEDAKQYRIVRRLQTNGQFIALIAGAPSCGC